MVRCAHNTYLEIMPAAQDGIIRVIVLPVCMENRFSQELQHHFHVTLYVN